MLNCTDLECILHHHYYYAHLHHLQKDLPTLNNGTPGTALDDVMSTEADDTNDTLQSLIPDTGGSELESLSHLDDPNDELYMLGGVLIAMFMVGIVIVLVAVAISKLRKREENSNSVHPTDLVMQTTTTNGHAALPIQGFQAAASQTTPPSPKMYHEMQVTTASFCNGASVTITNSPSQGELTYRGQILWQYPPPPPAYDLYGNDEDTLVQNLQRNGAESDLEEPHGFVRGFRKNLGGRWRRLVKKKPENELYSIPAELKPQLKQIYVY